MRVHGAPPARNLLHNALVDHGATWVRLCLMDHPALSPDIRPAGIKEPHQFYECGSQEFESLRARRHCTIYVISPTGAVPRLPDAASSCIDRIQCPALAGSNDGRATRRVTDRLDAMTVGIQHERAIVIGVIVRPKPRRAVVAPPTRKRCRMKGIDCGAVGSAKADMCAGDGRPHLGFASDGEFNTWRPRCCAIIGTATLAEINDAYEPKRTQHRVVKSATAVDIGNTQ
jgi:hypothetical protein